MANTPAASPTVSSTVGLKNMVIAPLTVDTEETLTYGDLQLVAGAIEASITPENADPDIQYADDIEFDVLYPDPELTFTTKMADIPLAIQEQIFGNKIIVHLNDSTVDWARLPQFGFVAEHIDEEFYNQLTGKEMFATFEKGELRHLDVSGNVQAIMLPQEDDSTYNKIANLESSYMAADFSGQNLERMKLWPETSGTMTPLYLAKKNLFYLPTFRWFEPLRPLKPEDVFVITEEMRALFSEPDFGTSRRK